MTDLEKAYELFESFGLDVFVDKNDPNYTSIEFRENSYVEFYYSDATFFFDSDGKFLVLKLYEN